MTTSKLPVAVGRRILPVAALVIGAMALAGCEGVKDQLGLNPTPPDEFTVVTKAPLVMPPDFSLRPPEPGAARPQELSARSAARNALFGGGAQPGGQGSYPAGDDSRTAGEKALLTLAGANGIDSGIRSTVNQETAAIERENDTFLNTLIFWRDKATDNVVDPMMEARRIRENSAAGRPINEGDTATIKRRDE